VHTSEGAYSVLPSQGIPAWAIALIVLGALTLAVLVVQICLTRRRASRGPQARLPWPPWWH
jgi:hypothetical protein